jgi:O-antigen/teichoic acid export membrane protein
MLASSINVAFAALDKLFVKHYCTMADVGVYASAMNLMAIFTVVRTTFNGIWMPAAVGHYEKNPEDKKFYQRGNALISVVMLTFGAGVVLFKDLFVLLLGKEYQAASLILPYLMFEPIMYTISETTATGMVVQKKPVYQVIVAGGSCLSNFIGNWILTPRMGPQGAALSTGIAYIVFFALRTGLSNRVYYVPYRLPRFAVAVAALMAFAVYASNRAFTWIQLLMCAGVVAVVAVAYREDIWYGIQTYLLRKRK